MIVRAHRFAVVGTCSALLCAGCSGDDEKSDGGPPEPLLGGSVSGTFRDTAFTPSHGVARSGGKTADGAAASEGMTIHLSTARVGCETDFGKGFPLGTYVEAGVPTQAPGQYADFYVYVLNTSKTSEGFSLKLVGSAKDTLISIASVDDDAVAGALSMTRDDPETGTTAVAGDFVVTRCF
jgi:hypothetical protein